MTATWMLRGQNGGTGERDFALTLLLCSYVLSHYMLLNVLWTLNAVLLLDSKVRFVKVTKNDGFDKLDKNLTDS